MSTSAAVLPQVTPLDLERKARRPAVLRAVLEGLSATPRTLPPWLFYDERGSELFEQITGLPEYYLTRSERAILSEYAGDILGTVKAPVTLAELGAGTATKTGLLLEAAARLQPETLYQPIDVSPSALAEAASLAGHIPGLMVHPQVVNYTAENYRVERPAGASILALYIGSSIGNFNPPEAIAILKKLRSRLNSTTDALLLGVDLAPCAVKSVATVLAAYNDAAGVTAAFNKNILTRLNTELGANFNLDAFAHRAVWNAEHSRIEMHLESLVNQTVTIDGKTFSFLSGETIHTENSYKFTERSVRSLLGDAGFATPAWFYDKDCNFAVALAFTA